jgi:TusA-related sulfurtransferase
MEIKRQEIRARIEAMSDEELLQMLTDEPEQYRPDALAWAKEVAAARNLDWQSISASATAEEIHANIEAMSDKELLQVLANDPGQYEPEALAWAKEAAAKRNLVPESISDSDKTPESSEADNLPDIGESILAEDAGSASPECFSAAGKQIICPHCQHDQFESQSFTLNTRGSTAFNPDLLKTPATALSCSKCGLIQWFTILPDRLET